MDRPAAILLVGGRSTRMGQAKATLDWHGEPLAARVARVLLRAVGGGPVIAIAAPGQELPALPPGVELAADPAEGEGPLRGLAVGLAALEGRADVAFVSAVDAPFLHARLVTAVLGALDDAHDIALPVAHGHRQPLAAAYRVALAPSAAVRLQAGEPRLGAFVGSRRTRFVPADELVRLGGLEVVDPALEGLRNVNTPEEYAEALATPPPLVTVGGLEVRAWHLEDAVTVDGVPTRGDRWFPLGPGDRVELRGPGAAG